MEKANLIKLYGGKVAIHFDPATHRFVDRAGEPIISVTSVTGIIDKSGALMGWAIKLMGEYLKEKWDTKRKWEELEKIALIDEAKREYRKAQREAMDIGTVIHDWVEQWIRGKNPVIPDDDRVRNGVTAFMKWVKETGIKFKNTELVVYSKKYNYAGIMDADGTINGDSVITDWKSSSGIYNEYFYQLAGYWNAREEETGKKYIGGWIVQFGKETGDFDARFRSRAEYLKDREAFLAALTIKRRELELK